MGDIDVKQLIKNYIKLDDELTGVLAQAKDLRKQKSQLEEDIKEYMLANEIAKVDIGSGVLKIRETKLKKKIDKKTIMSVLLDSIDNHDVANNIIEEIFNEEEDAEVIRKLERSKKK